MAFDFLPTNKAELKQKGWTDVDIILVSGDAYVDHASFGAAFIGRYLEDKGYRVGIISQPDWSTSTDFQQLGEPRLFFAVTAGNLDSMIANYSSEKKKRKKDLYSENGTPGKRPDRATIVYTNKLKQLFPETPILLGGIEASLRRITHYDFWSDSLRRPLLVDSRATILVYGLGEKALVTIAKRIEAKKRAGFKLEGELLGHNEGNCCYLSETKPKEAFFLPSYEELSASSDLFAKTELKHIKELSKKAPRKIAQQVQGKWLIVEPPKPPDEKELNNYWKLPFVRKAHPRYKQDIPAYGFVRFSLTAHRGCFGGCSFCTLTVHQGKHVISRSPESVLNELEVIVKDPAFKGTILDVGGPSADMYKSKCTSKDECSRLSCIYPQICPYLQQNQNEHLSLLKKVKSHPKVKNVFIGSGIRFDYSMQSHKYLQSLVSDFTGGQLSVAPEHLAPRTLDLMKKPDFSVYEKFRNKFLNISAKAGKEQHLIPYFLSSHPGTTLKDALTLALYLRDNNLRYDQAQNFIPIPMSLSAAMYYSELDPLTKKKIHVAKGRERELQKALLQPHLKTNNKLIAEALEILNKQDLYNYITYQGSYKNDTNKVKYTKHSRRKKHDNKRRVKRTGK